MDAGLDEWGGAEEEGSRWVRRKNDRSALVQPLLCGSSYKARVTSDGGLILVRELGEWLGLGKLVGRRLDDAR
jgi:hypothetical protein